MTKKSVQKLNRAIVARNRRFARLTAAGKRVAIAKDVLKELRGHRLRPTSGTYLEGPGVKFKKEDAGRELAEFLPAIKKCDACAIGSMFLCCVKLADELTVDEATRGDTSTFGDTALMDIGGHHAYLARFFPDLQLKSIEATFECWGGMGDARLSGLTDCQRMKLIMENIVRNRGTFRKDDKTMLAAVKS